MEANDQANKKSFLDLSVRLDKQAASISKQGQDISRLGNAMTSQHQLISKIQETQVFQGNAIVRIDGSQNQILEKVDRLLQTFNSTQAEHPHGRGGKNEYDLR